MLLMPALGAYADVHARKKAMLAAVTVGCVLATAALASIGPGDLWAAALLLVLSNFCYAAGVALNSAFLPELSRPAALGKVSGWGWSIGYIGGLAALGLSLAYVLAAQARGAPATHYVPVTMVITAVLFAAASLVTFALLKERARPLRDASVGGMVNASTRRMWHTLRHIGDFRDFGWLMLCGLLYQAGLNVVIALAAIYAQQVMQFDTAQTMTLVLLVNVTAAIGAFSFGYVQDALGHRRALALTIAGWIAMIAIATASTSAAGFWVAANVAGLCMGSSQSAGRAMVGVFTPSHRLAEFYGLWNAAVWLSAILGPVTYGLVTWLTENDHRLAMMITGAYFVAGLLVLGLVDVERGRQAAAREADGDPAG
jgi:MFS transporter, UMF1 family